MILANPGNMIQEQVNRFDLYLSGIASKSFVILLFSESQAMKLAIYFTRWW